MKRLLLLLLISHAVNSISQLSNSVPTSGPVGIGTASPDPSKQLTVNGNSTMLGSLDVDQNITISGQSILKNFVRMPGILDYAGDLFGDLDIMIIDSSGNVTRGSARDIMTILMDAEPYELAYCSELLTTHPQWFSGLNKLFSPCPDVKVGIGTADPSHQLSVVVGTSYLNNLLVGNSEGSILGAINGFAKNHTEKLIVLGKKVGALEEEIRFTIDNNGSAELTTVGEHPSLTIHRGSGQAIIIYDNAGNRLFQLENNGLVRSRRIKVDNADWADYVFNTEYAKMPLTELKEFIRKNKRLPNIPSAEKVKNEGLDLAEMQKLQMEKIEELTLYLLDMNEDIQELRAQNDILRNELNELKK